MRSSGRFALAASISLALARGVLVAAAPAPAPLVLRGHVENGTPGAKAPAGIELTLLRYAGMDQTEVAKTATDAAGRFAFTGLEPDSPAAAEMAAPEYAVRADYLGAEYYSEAVALRDEAAKDRPLVVYETTTTKPDLQVQMHHVVVSPTPDGALSVKEILVFHNEADRAYIGAGPKEARRRPTMQFTLPRQATDLEYLSGLANSRAQTTDSGFVDTMPVTPGSHSVSYRYRLTPKGNTLDLRRPLDYPTANFDVMISGDGLKASSQQLTDAGPTAIGGEQYLHFQGANLEAGAAPLIRLMRSGPAAPRPSWRRPMLALLVGALFLAGLIYVGLRRSSRAGVEAEGRPAPPAEQAGLSAAARRLDLKLERQGLLNAAAELDDAFAAGRISEAEYRRLRDPRKQRLLELTEELRRLGDS